MIESLRRREMTTGASRVFGLLLIGIALLLSIAAARAVSRLALVAGPQPGFVSFVTLEGEEDGLASSSEDPRAFQTGGVASVSWEEFRVAPGGSGAGVEQPMGSGVRRYDTRGHETERIERDSSRVSVPEWRMTSEYRNGLLVRTSTRSFLQTTGQETGDEVWETFEYDAAGRVTEYRSGRGQSLGGHFTNRYDASGRIVRRETRGANDAPINTQKFSYATDSATVEQRFISPDGKVKGPDRYRLDDAGRVVELWVQEGFHVRWKYDSQGRVAEQATDGDTSAGLDVFPIPGTIRTRYEGAVREQVFFSTGGKALFRRIAQMERDGSISSIHDEVIAGAKTEDAPEFFGMIRAITARGGRNYTESTWDRRDNWIERRWYSQPNGGSPVLRFVVRRTIVYR